MKENDAKKAAMDRFGDCCAVCGQWGTELHHRHYDWQVGEDGFTTGSLVPLCPACHLWATAKKAMDASSHFKNLGSFLLYALVQNKDKLPPDVLECQHVKSDLKPPQEGKPPSWFRCIGDGRSGRPKRSPEEATYDFARVCGKDYEGEMMTVMGTSMRSVLMATLKRPEGQFGWNWWRPYFNDEEDQS